MTAVDISFLIFCIVVHLFGAWCLIMLISDKELSKCIGLENKRVRLAMIYASLIPVGSLLVIIYMAVVFSWVIFSNFSQFLKDAINKVKEE